VQAQRGVVIAMSDSVVAGTMRSTIVDGKLACSTIHHQRRVAHFGKGKNEPAHQRAVVRQVVAAQHGEGAAVREPARPAPGDQSDRALRLLRMREIVRDIGCAD
jgi:hypothetical protein